MREEAGAPKLKNQTLPIKSLSVGGHDGPNEDAYSVALPCCQMCVADRSSTGMIAGSEKLKVHKVFLKNLVSTVVEREGFTTHTSSFGSLNSTACRPAPSNFPLFPISSLPHSAFPALPKGPWFSQGKSEGGARPTTEKLLIGHFL